MKDNTDYIIERLNENSPLNTEIANVFSLLSAGTGGKSVHTEALELVRFAAQGASKEDVFEPNFYQSTVNLYPIKKQWVTELRKTTSTPEIFNIIINNWNEASPWASTYRILAHITRVQNNNRPQEDTETFKCILKAMPQKWTC